MAYGRWVSGETLLPPAFGKESTSGYHSPFLFARKGFLYLFGSADAGQAMDFSVSANGEGGETGDENE